MRFFYSILFYLFYPFIIIYLIKRSKKNPDYKKHWNQRFGYKLINPSNKPIIWIHAVSVGETRAIAKIVKLIKLQYPDYQLLITQMTPTGRKTANQLYSDALLHYIPYDFPHAIINFYKTFKPCIGIIIETEIWPNLIYYANKLNIPLILANARLSDKSFRGYNKLRYVITPIINKFNLILTQDKTTYNNFKKLGFINQINIIGNIKFDIIVNNKYYSLAKDIKKFTKKAVVFASTRENEEKIILSNLPKNLDYLIIIIPRHPERFNDVEQLIKQTGLNYTTRTSNQIIDDNIQILLGNTMGEMFMYYLLADIAIIGGSFENLGGQNLIEPLSVNKPVIFGKYMFNFKSIAENALINKCAIKVDNMSECFIKINELLKNNNLYQKYVDNSKKFVIQYQGASQKVLNAITNYL